MIPTALLLVMPTVIQAVTGATFGALTTYFVMRRARGAALDPTDAIAWRELPLPIRRQDPVTFAFIALHVAAHLALALLAVRDALLPRPAAPDGPLTVLNAAGVTVAWLAAGVTGAFVVCYRRVGRVPVGLGASGTRHFGRLVPWSLYSHGVADPAARAIRVYSAGLPGVARVTWHPPTDALFAQAAALVAEVLPSSAPPDAPRRWRWAPVAWLAAGVLPLLLGATLLAGRAWAGAYVAVTAYAMLRLSPALLRRFDLD